MVLFVVGGCSSAGSGSSGPGSSPGAANGSASDGPSASIPGPASIRDEIIADAARRAGVDPADVTVLSAEARTWGDGSLGCPEAGMSYTQVQVDGYQAIVSAGSNTYDYRIGRGRWRLCENGAR
jgi:hypothetical protein